MRRLDYCRVNPVMSKATLRIMATTDLHMNIMPYDYLSDSAVDDWGLTNTAHLIQTARDEVANSILLDNGDFLHGTPMGDLVVERNGATSHAEAQNIHPMIAAMDHLNYDAAALGNHDFDRGTDVLLRAVKQAGFPIVSANTVSKRASTPTQDDTLVAPYTILARQITDENGKQHDIRIGVIGFLPPGSLQCGLNRVTPPDVRDIVETAQAYVPYLKGKGVDVIVALAHSGIGPVDHVPNMENALVPLSRVKGIDAIVGGHTHQVFPPTDGDLSSTLDCEGFLNGVPTVLPGFWGSHLGVIDLELERQGAQWRVARRRAGLRAVDTMKQAQAVEKVCNPAQKPCLPELLKPLHESTLSHMRTPIGRSRRDLENCLALVGADSATRIVQEAMAAHARQIQRDLLGTRLPVLASSAPSKSGGLAGPNYYTNAPSGEMTLRSLSDLYIFPNELALLRVTGAFLKTWLERSASIFNQVSRGGNPVFLKADATPGYLQESVLGVTYQIDLTQPAQSNPPCATLPFEAGRISDLRHDGRLVAPDDEFLLATNDFRAGGGGGYPQVRADQTMDIPPISIRALLRAYIETAGPVDVPTSQIWRFAKIGGARVRFKSTPHAASAADNYPWLSIQCAQDCDEDGFAHYEMEL